jgi:Transglycosylase SLT domain
MLTLNSTQNTTSSKPSIHLGRRGFLRGSAAGIAATVIGGLHGVLNANPTMDADRQSKTFFKNRWFDLEWANARYDAAMRKRIADAGPVETTLWHEFLSPARLALISSLSGGFWLNSEMMRRLVIIESEGKTDAVSHKWAQWLMQIMPSTMPDFTKRFGSHYDLLVRALPPESFTKFADKDTRYFVNELRSRDYQTREKAIYALIGRSNMDPEVNLLLGHLYFARLKKEIIESTNPGNYVLPKLVSLSSSEIIAINGHRSKLRAPAIPLLGTQEFLTRAIGNNPIRQTYLAALAQYNGWGNPPPSSYAYAATIAL